jgi:hypothetical protein
MLPSVPERHKPSKVRWSAPEDHLLAQNIDIFGTLKWSIVATFIPGRTGKQCRERWLNQVNPRLNFEVWTPEEDSCLMGLVALRGRQWALISQFLPGRSANSAKNRFNFLMKHGTSSRLRPPTELAPSLRPEPELMAPGRRLKLPPIDIIPLEPRDALFFTL